VDKRFHAKRLKHLNFYNIFAY